MRKLVWIICGFFVCLGSGPEQPKKSAKANDKPKEIARLKDEVCALRAKLKDREDENKVVWNTVKKLKYDLQNAKGNTHDGLSVIRNLRNSTWSGRITNRVDDGQGTVFILENNQDDLNVRIKLDLAPNMKPGDLTVGHRIKVEGHIWKYQLEEPGFLNGNKETFEICISRAMVLNSTEK